MSKYKRKPPRVSRIIPLEPKSQKIPGACPRCKGKLLKVRTSVSCFNCGYEAVEEEASREANESFRENKGQVWGR